MKQKSPGSQKGPQKTPVTKLKESSKDRESKDWEDEPIESSEEDEDELEDPSEPTESEISSSLPTTSLQSETEIVPAPSNDPLKRYLQEMKNYPLLDPQEEYALAIRLKDHGDLSAAKALITANLRLVVKIAFEYRNFYSNVLDLIQEGNIGLMKAVSKFDPTQGTRLGYYASWWIRSYVLKYLLDNFRLVKVGTTQAQKKLFYHLMREKEKLEAQGLVAGPKLLAEKLNVREKDVIEMGQRLSGRGAETSLEAPAYTDAENQTSHKDLLVDGKESADEVLGRQELIQILKQQLPEFQKQLNDKERRILSDRLLAEEPKTLQEVADLYGLTRERARQIEAKVIDKLREFLRPILAPQ